MKRKENEMKSQLVEEGGQNDSYSVEPETQLQCIVTPFMCRYSRVACSMVKTG